jgi:hypothetical protein
MVERRRCELRKIRYEFSIRRIARTAKLVAKTVSKLTFDLETLSERLCSRFPTTAKVQPPTDNADETEREENRNDVDYEIGRTVLSTESGREAESEAGRRRSRRGRSREN